MASRMKVFLAEAEDCPDCKHRTVPDNVWWFCDEHDIECETILDEITLKCLEDMENDKR